jgi:nitroimidazol reductase NimA-like FMN-containing flavoprotein (pyridoxamine 5'-phosphate oxidase superfamily)
MEPDELRAFLASDSRLVLATVSEDGSPWADAAACHFASDRMYFRVPVHTRSYRHIEADPRVCVVVESKPAGTPYYGIKEAMLHGRAEPCTDPAILEALAAVPDPVDGSHDGTIYSVGLEGSTSFSFQKIQYRYQDRALT